MPQLADLIRSGKPVEAHRPWPRVVVTSDVWQNVASALAEGRATLLGPWGDSIPAPAVHMAIMGEDGRQIAVITFDCPGGSFPSVSAVHPPAIRLERATFCFIRARTYRRAGYAAVARSRLLGCAVSAGCPKPAPTARTDYAFLPVEGESLHQIAVGPVHAGIIEPGHFRFTAGGETVARLEQRLGYVHKGIESLMAGATIERAAQLAARTSGDSTVAYGIAFRPRG